MSQAKIEETLQGYILDLSTIFMTGLYLKNNAKCKIYFINFHFAFFLMNN